MQLNTATNYDERSRIRTQIRIVKKKTGGSASATASPLVSRKNVAPASTCDDSSTSAPTPADAQPEEKVDMEVMEPAKETDMKKHTEELVTSVTSSFYSTSSSSMSQSTVTSTDDCKSQKVTVQRSSSQLMTPHLPEPEVEHPEMARTLDITSSYGTGPMDENGRPLFGLGALRRRNKPSESLDSG